MKTPPRDDEPDVRRKPAKAPPSGNGHEEPEVIALSRWRAALARARRGHRADVILAEPDAAKIVPQLPIQELYYLLKETGLHDAGDLLALASPEQVRGFLDFDLWDRDRLDDVRAAPWLDALLDLGPAKVLRHAKDLDPEVLALLVQRRVRVYDLSMEPIPEEPEGHFYPTPDRFFLLDVLGEGEEGKRTERLVDWLYRGDLVFAKQVLMAARWELPSDLEEWSYRWRSGRMADLGFIDYHEALEVYRWLDPATVEPDEESVAALEPSGDEGPRVTTLPVLLADAVGERGFLGRALATVEDAGELERLQGALVTLTNRVMAADRAEPGEPEAAARALGRVVETLSLGLEFLARGDARRGGEVLAKVALVRLFRVGFSLTLKLQRAAETLVARGFVSLVPGQPSLLDEPLRSIVRALRRKRPEYPLALEDPARLDGTRGFQTLADLARAAQALEEASRLGPLVRESLGVEPRLLEPAALAGVTPPRERIRFSTVGATLAANVLLDRPAALVPLAAEDLARLRDQAMLDDKLRPTARLTVSRALEARMKEREHEAPDGWDQTLDAWLRHLEETLRPVGAGPVDPALVDGVLLKA